MLSKFPETISPLHHSTSVKILQRKVYEQSSQTEEEYETLIDKISTSDIEKYNQDFLKNSDINIKIRMNKDDYNQNQDVIYKYFDKTNINYFYY